MSNRSFDSAVFERGPIIERVAKGTIESCHYGDEIRYLARDTFDKEIGIFKSLEAARDAIERRW